MSKSLRLLLIIISLVNLCFLTVWRELLFASASDSYWLPPYGETAYWAIIMNVLGGSLLIWSVAILIGRSRSPSWAVIGHIALLAGLLLPLSYLRLALGVDSDTIHWAREYWYVFIPAAALVATAAVYVLLYRFSALMAVVSMVLLILSPFAFVNIIQAAWKAVSTAEAATADKVDASASGSRQRIVVILMDELDFRLAFDEPPAGLELPAFKEFRDQAIFAHNATSHSRQTEEAIPSYLLQKLVFEADPIDPYDLNLHFMGDPEDKVERFSDHENLFEQIARDGGKIGIVGYYHPYCRLFASSVSRCSRYAFNTYTPAVSDSLTEEMGNQVIATLPIFKRVNGIKVYQRMREDILGVSTDPMLDFVYMHASVPHGPNIYDRRNKRMTLLNTSREGYFDNLVLADMLFGQIRAAMEEAKLWQDSVVLLVSDHEWRWTHLHDGLRVPKVPFLLKMPNQKMSRDFHDAFSPMLVTKDLLWKIRQKEIATAEHALAWLFDRRDRSGRTISELRR